MTKSVTIFVFLCQNVKMSANFGSIYALAQGLPRTFYSEDNKTMLNKNYRQL